MAYKTIHYVFVPNLKVFGLTKMELEAKEVGEFSIMLYGKMGRYFCIYWYIELKLAKTFQIGLIYIE